MSDYCIDNDNIVNGESNNFCVNDFDFSNSTLIKPPEGKQQKLAQKFIFIDSSDFTLDGNGKLTFTLDETIKDIVEIELMSVHIPPVSSNPPSPYPAKTNYLLLFIDNIDITNYKICKNSAVSKCFARLPITGMQNNVFFGRIKNFTNIHQFKPILQSLNKFDIRITDKRGFHIPAFAGTDATNSFQLTIGVTYQTQPYLFDS